MPGHYSSDELKSLVRILNDILAEARRCRPDLSKDEIVERIFSLADDGERDAQKLHQAVFGIGELNSSAEIRRSTNQNLSIAGMKNAIRANTISRRYRLA
jgi:hypothetical protein